MEQIEAIELKKIIKTMNNKNVMITIKGIIETEFILQKIQCKCF